MRSRDTLDARALAQLLAPLFYMSAETITRNISRRPKSLPRPVEINGRKIWVVEDVVDFYPPAIRAAIRRAIAREFQDELSARPRISPPAMRPLAEDLAACAMRGDEVKA